VTPQWIFAIATLLAAAAMWLMLPRGGAPGRKLGAALGLAALGLFGAQLPWLFSWYGNVVFGVLAAVTIIAAAATVTARNPVYSAIWFALVLLGVAGLFLLQGAQFLGIATVVVYAGAILVTFLFVLMLAQPEGHAFYDRISWEPLLSAATGAVLVGMLTTIVAQAFQDPAAIAAIEPVAHQSGDLAAGVLAEQHVARLGGAMFSRHLIAVEAAGALLLAALVGAVSIVAHGKQTPPAPRLARNKQSEGRSDAAGSLATSATVAGDEQVGGRSHG
jgi:NADH-quinone oxidoreductase subunit J